LCGYLQETFGRTITFVAKVPIIVEAVHATALAVVVNELVTNAVKHGDGPVKVTCASSDDTLRIMVQNAGKPLPKGFVLGEGTGFGLRAAKTMVEGLSGKVTADSLEMGGAVFEVAVPLSAVKRR
jgi:two-component sensor histidine kinase